MSSNRVFLCDSLLKFPGSVPDFREASGGALIDAVEFSSDVVYHRLESIGDEERANYRFRNLTIDLLLPLSLFTFLFL